AALAPSTAARATDNILQIESMAITVIGDARGQPVAAGRSRAPAILRGRVTTARNTPRPRDFRAYDELGYRVT
ncbi:hypothetical protein, partial [Burkholderia cenocepacia]|uniref:hypothetical protein n=1 Tax=Burkholderia cenocepacia TaxID=95486 RepID=UPI001C4E091B